VLGECKEELERECEEELERKCEEWVG